MAVNTEAQHDAWAYRVIQKLSDLHEAVASAALELAAGGAVASSPCEKAAADSRLIRPGDK